MNYKDREGSKGIFDHWDLITYETVDPGSTDVLDLTVWPRVDMETPEQYKRRIANIKELDALTIGRYEGLQRLKEQRDKNARSASKATLKPATVTLKTAVKPAKVKATRSSSAEVEDDGAESIGAFSGSTYENDIPRYPAPVSRMRIDENDEVEEQQQPSSRRTDGEGKVQVQQQPLHTPPVRKRLISAPTPMVGLIGATATPAKRKRTTSQPEASVSHRQRIEDEKKTGVAAAASSKKRKISRIGHSDESEIEKGAAAAAALHATKKRRIKLSGQSEDQSEEDEGTDAAAAGANPRGRGRPPGSAATSRIDPMKAEVFDALVKQQRAQEEEEEEETRPWSQELHDRYNKLLEAMREHDKTSKYVRKTLRAPSTIGELADKQNTVSLCFNKFNEQRRKEGFKELPADQASLYKNQPTYFKQIHLEGLMDLVHNASSDRREEEEEEEEEEAALSVNFSSMFVRKPDASQNQNYAVLCAASMCSISDISDPNASTGVCVKIQERRQAAAASSAASSEPNPSFSNEYRSTHRRIAHIEERAAQRASGMNASTMHNELADIVNEEVARYQERRAAIDARESQQASGRNAPTGRLIALPHPVTKVRMR